jgi:DNA gyrase subunit A
MRLAEEGDAVVSLNLVKPNSELLIVTEYGYSKRTPIDEYPRQGRGGGGVITAKVTDKTGRVVAARVISESDSDLMVISASGVVIRIDVSKIKTAGRATQGVILMNLNEGDTVVAVSATNGKKLEAANGETQDNNGAESEIADDGATVDLEETAKSISE